jgi:hypothetical protein
MFTYSEQQLRELLELWREGGHLSPAQMEALAEWDQTPDDVREALRPGLEENRRHAAAIAPAPLTPTQSSTAAGRDCCRSLSEIA